MPDLEAAVVDAYPKCHRQLAIRGRRLFESTRDRVEMAPELPAADRRFDDGDHHHGREQRHGDLRPDRRVLEPGDGVLHWWN